MSLNDGQASGTFARLMLSMCRCCTDKTLFTFVRAGLISFLPFTDCRLLKLQSGQQPGRTSPAEPRAPVCQKYYLPAAWKELPIEILCRLIISLVLHFTVDLEKCTFSPLFTAWVEVSCENVRFVGSSKCLLGDNKKVRPHQLGMMPLNWNSCWR